MKRKTILKEKGKTIFISIIAIVLIVISYVLITSSINIKTSENVQVLSYNESSNVDYNVYLKENAYFTEKYLPKNQQYIASLIDYVDANFSYDLSLSKHINATYKYKIIATLSAQYRVDANNLKKVWTNDYVLLDEKTATANDTGLISIKENVKIDYGKYNEIINNFKKDYMLSVASDLVVKLVVEVDGTELQDNVKFNADSTSTLTIPLSEQTLNIEMDYDELETNEIVDVEKLGKFNNFFTFAVGVVMLIVSFIIFAFEIKNVIQEEKKQSKYIKKLRKILHDYGDIIVEANNPPAIDDAKSIEVKSFNELINAQIELHAPIIFAEEIRNEVGMFVVMNSNYAYFYKLKSNEESEKA